MTIDIYRIVFNIREFQDENDVVIETSLFAKFDHRIAILSMKYKTTRKTNL